MAGSLIPRVLFVSYTADEVGPTRSLLTILDRLGSSWAPMVLTVPGSFLREELAIRSIPCFQFKTLGRRQVLRLILLLRRQRIDLVYCNTADGTFRTALLASRFCGLPTVCHVRSMGRSRNWHKLAHLRFASRVIGVSRACTESVSQFVSSSRLSTVYNAVAIDPATKLAATEEEIDRIRCSASAGPGTVLLLSLGHVCARKAQVDAVNVMDRLRSKGLQARLLIAGSLDREPDYTARVRSAIDDCGLGQEVHLLGFRRDLPALFAASDILLHTATDDPHPRAVIEAMAAGLPVVAYPVDGVAETVEHGVTGRLSSDLTVDGLSEEVEVLAENKELRERMARAACQKAAALFSAEGHGDAIAKVMREALDDSAESRSSDRTEVCIVNPWFYPLLVGPGERFRRYAPLLSALGVDLSVFTARHDGLEQYERIDTVRVRRVGSSTRPYRRVLLWRYLVSVVRGPRPDIVQVISVDPGWWMPLVILRVMGVPTLLVLTMLGSEGGGRLRRVARKLYRRWLYSSFDRIVVSSATMSRALTDIGVAESRLNVIPNGVDLERFRPHSSFAERERERSDLGFEPGDEVILFIGGVFPRKGVEVLADAWGRVVRERPRARLIIVGSRNEAQEKYADYVNLVDRYVRESSAPGRVEFVGEVEDPERYLRCADVFAFPSRREGMPNVVPEAMASGVPCVIAPFIGLPPEFGTSGEHYVLSEHDPVRFARDISELLGDDERRRRLALEGRRWVENELDVGRSVARYATVYRELDRERDRGESA